VDQSLTLSVSYILTCDVPSAVPAVPAVPAAAAATVDMYFAASQMPSNA
jgi:hypothetical protein